MFCKELLATLTNEDIAKIRAIDMSMVKRVKSYANPDRKVKPVIKPMMLLIDTLRVEKLHHIADLILLSHVKCDEYVVNLRGSPRGHRKLLLGLLHAIDGKMESVYDMLITELRAAEPINIVARVSPVSEDVFKEVGLKIGRRNEFIAAWRNRAPNSKSNISGLFTLSKEDEEVFVNAIKAANLNYSDEKIKELFMLSSSEINWDFSNWDDEQFKKLAEVHELHHKQF